jgi:hypothetical protein
MQTVTLLIIKARGTYSYRSALKGSRDCTVRSRRIAYIFKGPLFKQENILQLQR